jgi:hypothetical protein
LVINDASRRRPRKNLQRTHLGPAIRYALAQVTEKLRCRTPSETIREMVLDGLRGQGWTEQRMNAEYLAYAAECARVGKENEYAEDGVR